VLACPTATGEPDARKTQRPVSRAGGGAHAAVNNKTQNTLRTGRTLSRLCAGEASR